ncbi:MAG: mechanosensitive ion channel [Rhodospirillales bacterium]
MSDESSWIDYNGADIGEALINPSVFLQFGVIAVTAAFAWLLAMAVRRRIGTPVDDPKKGAIRSQVEAYSYAVRDLLFPVFNAALLGVAVAISEGFFDQKWLVQFVQGINFLAVNYLVATRISKNATVRYFSLFVLTPIFFLYAVSLLGNVIEILEEVRFEIGNIELTLYALIRTVVFGAVLFWLGRLSNATGQTIIREKVKLEDSTRELVAKLYQIVLVVVIGVLLFQIAGIDISALLVFGGAIGVGLGFGLQQIASNFISGMIILFDRSVTVGDYIQLEDGRSGTIRELTMRSATLETFDGKDIMVPNETFITTTFTNWTHNNKKQRYPLTFEVAYDTDLEALFPILREVVASHPQVLSGDNVPIHERPDAEIQAFNDSGIEILVEFWMEDIDDGKNRVGGDLLLMIWSTLREHGVEIPFPHRVVTVKNEDGSLTPAPRPASQRKLPPKAKPRPRKRG